MTKLQRFGVSVETDLLDKFDEFIRERLPSGFSTHEQGGAREFLKDSKYDEFQTKVKVALPFGKLSSVIFDPEYVIFAIFHTELATDDPGSAIPVYSKFSPS